MCADRHYLLCASRGALRLEAHGMSWVLPPARAALITAGEAIRVTIAQRVTTSSVLFEPGFASAATRAPDRVRPQSVDSGRGLGVPHVA